MDAPAKDIALLKRVARLWNYPNWLNTYDIARTLNMKESEVVKLVASAKREKLIP